MPDPKNVLVFNRREYTLEEIKEMDSPSLVDLQLEIQDTMDDLARKKQEAKLLYNRGEYSDPDWFRKASTAHRILIGWNRKISKILKDKKQKKHLESERSFERIFVRCARDYLPKDDYHAILEIANNEHIKRMDEEGL